MDPFVVFVRFVIFFTIFAVTGYLLEAFSSVFSIATHPEKRKLSNRGFLFGPYLPIYGFGGVIMIVLSQHIPQDNFVLTFLVAMAMGVMLEYVTSFALEKIFHLRWWDYSQTDKFNIHGRVCLRNALKFGVGGLIFVYLLLPGLNNLIDLMPWNLQVAIALIMTIVYSVDFIVSSYANMKVKNMEDFGKIIGDQTAEIKKNAKKVIKTIAQEKRKKRAARKKSH